MRAGRLMIILFASISLCLTISCNSTDTGAKGANAPTLQDPVKIDSGYISGTVIGDVGKEVHIYRGIPYAAPPTGDLRWKPPQPAPSWLGIHECTAFGKSSPQSTVPVDLSDMPQSEDCLYLNVLTPAKKASENLPVMVWLHGGGYTQGSGSSQIFNLPRLPQNGVVLATVNMRLGSLGLLAHPLLSKEAVNGISGNYLFLDMIAALKWVQRNIAAFGGDPQNVTIFGESGGGAKVSCLVASPMAKGLFHKAIFESGAAGGFSPGVSMKDMESVGERIFVKLGLDKSLMPLAAARALPAAKIIEAEQRVSMDLKTDMLLDSAVDGQFLADRPANIFMEGRQNAAPVITCANLGELTGPGMITMPYIVSDYVNILNGVNKAGQKGYACIFGRLPDKWKQEGGITFHALEIGYVFGNYDSPSLWWPTAFFLAKQSGAKSPDPGLSLTDRKVSENMMAMWAQFARTGNPNVKGLLEWPAYESAKDQYLSIAEPLEVKSGYSTIAHKK